MADKGGLIVPSEVIDPADQDGVELLVSSGAGRIRSVPRRSTRGPPGTSSPNFKGKWTKKGIAPWESDQGEDLRQTMGKLLRPAQVLSEGEEPLEWLVEEGEEEAQPQPRQQLLAWSL